MRRADPAVEFLTEVLAGRAPLDFGPPGADRDRTIELLTYHGLVGLWYAEASERGEPTAQLELEQGVALRERYLRSGFHSTMVIESARRARTALKSAGIPSLLFKGAALIEGGVYSEPACRSLDDTDLLVRETSARAAVEALQSVGFEPWVEWDDTRIGWLPAFTLSDAEAPEGIEVSLDLHWRTPYATFRSGVDDSPEILWDGADLEAGLPAPEPHFLIVAEHFLKHLRVLVHTKALGDMVRSLDRLSRPDVLTDLADRRGSLRGLRFMLATLGENFGVELPESLVHSAGVPRTLPRSVSKVLGPGRLLRNPSADPGTRLAGLRVQWMLKGSVLTMLRDVKDVVFPPNSWLDARYPQASSGWGARRRHHMKNVTAWLVGRGVSPLSPNQEFET